VGDEVSEVVIGSRKKEISRLSEEGPFR